MKRKIIKLFAVFSLTALLFAACGGGGGGEKSGTENYVSNLVMNTQRAGGTWEGINHPSQINPGGVLLVRAQVVLTGNTGSATRDYTIELVQPEGWECPDCSSDCVPCDDECEDECEEGHCPEDWRNAFTVSLHAGTVDQPVYRIVINPELETRDRTVQGDLEEYPAFHSIRIRFTSKSDTESTNPDFWGEQFVRELQIRVEDDPTLLDPSLWAFVAHLDTTSGTNIHNDTMQALPAVEANKRYIIRNRQADATLDSGDIAFRQSTFVYLNKGFQIKPGEELTAYGFEMRVKMIEDAGSTTLPRALTGADTRNGFLVGAFSNPFEFSSNDASPRRLNFAGIRATTTGQIRRYTTTTADGGITLGASSGALGGDFAGAPNFDAFETTAVNRVEGFIEQEYIYRVQATQGSFVLSVLTPDGQRVLATQVRDAMNVLGPHLLNNHLNFVYMGIIVVDAAVEISGIRYWEGNNPNPDLLNPTPGANNHVIWEDAATIDAVPADVNVRAIEITPRFNANEDFDFRCPYDLLSAFDYEDYTITLNTVPRSARDLADSISWSIPRDTSDPGATLSGSGTTDTGNSTTVNIKGLGEIDVKAEITSTKLTGETEKDFKFLITTLAPVNTIDITAPAWFERADFALNAGQGGIKGDYIVLTAAINFDAANSDDVTFRVSDDENCTDTTSTSAYAEVVGTTTYVPATGRTTIEIAAKAAALSGDQTVYVYATSPHGAGGTNFTSDGFPITIKPFSTKKVYNFSHEQFDFAIPPVPAAPDTSRPYALIGGLYFQVGLSWASHTADGYTAINDPGSPLHDVVPIRHVNTGGQATVANGRQLVIPIRGDGLQDWVRVTVYGYGNRDPVGNIPPRGDTDARMVHVNHSRTSVPVWLTNHDTAAGYDAARIADDILLFTNSGNVGSTVVPRVITRQDYYIDTTGTNAAPAEVVLWARHSVNIVGIVIDYDSGPRPVLDNTAERAEILAPTYVAAGIEYQRTLAFTALVHAVSGVASEDVTWHVSLADDNDVDEIVNADAFATIARTGNRAGLLNITARPTAPHTVYVFATVDGTDIVSDTFPVLILERDLVPATITISTTAGVMAMDGELIFTAVVRSASNNIIDTLVEWYVARNDTNVVESIVPATDYATITTTGNLTGKLEGADNLFGEDVWVFARVAAPHQSVVTAENIKIEVVEEIEGIVGPQAWQSHVSGGGTGTGPFGTFTHAGGILTGTGRGQFDGPNNNFNFAYINADAGKDFTMVVKLESLNWGGSTANSSRMGLVAFNQSDATQNIATGALTGATALFGSSSVIARAAAAGASEWGRFRRITGDGGGWGAHTGLTAPDMTPAGDKVYFRLRRVGNTFYAAFSVDNGVTFVTDTAITGNGSNEFFSTAGVHVGIFIGNNVATNTTTATFSNWRFAQGDDMGLATVTLANLEVIDLTQFDVAD
jgi:hypothetical protein